MDTEGLRDKLLLEAKLKIASRKRLRGLFYFLGTIVILIYLTPVLITNIGMWYVILIYFLLITTGAYFSHKRSKKISAKIIDRQYQKLIEKKLADYQKQIKKLQKTIDDDWTTYEDIQKKYQEDLKILFDSTQVLQKVSLKKISELNNENELLKQLKSNME